MIEEREDTAPASECGKGYLVQDRGTVRQELSLHEHA